MSTGAYKLIANGTATLTGTDPVSGKTVSVPVTVSTAPTLDHLDYTLSGSTATVGGSAPTGTVAKWQDAGETTPFAGSVTLGYVSNTPATATINSSGVITLVAAGTCTFTVTDSISGKSATTGTLTVSAAGASIPSPSGSATIYTDTGAPGSSTGFQAAGVTTITAAKNVFGDHLYDSGGIWNQITRFTKNYDGSGTSALCLEGGGWAQTLFAQAVTPIVTTLSGGITGNASTPQNFTLASATGFTSSSIVHLEPGTANEERVALTALSGTTATGLVKKNHANGVAIAAEQTVNVNSSSLIGHDDGLPCTVGAGWGTANVEQVSIPSKASGTITGAFTLTHASGDPIASSMDTTIPKLLTYFPPNNSQAGTRPRDLYFQWWFQPGRTAYEVSQGLGTGAQDILSFYNGHTVGPGAGTVANDSAIAIGTKNFNLLPYSGSNDGHKIMLGVRKSNRERLDLLAPGLGGASHGMNINAQMARPDVGNVLSTLAFDMNAAQGKRCCLSVHLRGQTNFGDSDGVCEVLFDDGTTVTTVLSASNLPFSTEDFDRIEFPSDINSMIQACTYYMVRVRAYSEPWVGVVPPDPSSTPTFVSHVAGSVTVSVPVPSSGVDGIRWWSTTANGGNLGFGLYTNLSQDSTITSGQLGTTVQYTLTVPSGQTTKLCYSFGLSGRYGFPSVAYSETNP